MTKQSIQWLPLYKLPIFTTLVEGMLQDTKGMYQLLLQAKNKPWVMDDATMNRTIKLFTERLEMLPDHTEQITRWKKEKLSPNQKEEITRLEEATTQTMELVENILTLAKEMKPHTIDQILAKDNAELALDVLSGKLKI